MRKMDCHQAVLGIIAGWGAIVFGVTLPVIYAMIWGHPVLDHQVPVTGFMMVVMTVLGVASVGIATKIATWRG